MTSRAAPSFGKKEREKSGWEKEVSPRCPKASMMVFWVIFCLRLLSGSSGWSAVAETDEWETVKVLVSKKQMEHRNGEIDERQLIEIIENGSIQSPQWSNYKDISLEKIRLKLVGWLGNELWSMEFDARNSTSSNWFDLARLTADSRNLTKDNMRLVYQQCEGAVKFKIYNTQSRSKGQGWLVAVDRGDSRGSLSNGVDISDVGFLIMMSQDISAQIFPHLHFQGNKYRGCFLAKNITSPCMDAEDITLNKCISYCSHNNRTYAGLMNRNKTCCCGNFYKPANCRKESQCDRICADEKYTNCCRNVYDVRDTGASSHVGCFDEALLRKDKETTFSPMVFDYCRQFCYHHKYLYMGLQRQTRERYRLWKQKNHCFCSSVIWNVEKKDEQLCSFYCSGEKYKQRCGSRKPGHVSVYNTQKKCGGSYTG